jgi:hypothetical protein
MFDEDRFTTLLDRYVDDVLTPTELTELDEVLQASPQARSLFWEHARWNAVVRGWGEGTWGGSQSMAPLATTAGPWWRRGPVLSRRRLLAAGSTAAALAGAWAGSVAIRRWLHPPAGQAAPTDVAIVTALRDGRWRGSGPGLGQAVGPRRLVLEHGEVGIGFSSGAELIVRSPAVFSIRSGLRLELAEGMLAAHVPPEAEGFVVKTPSVEVIDLGTSFGVAADAAGTVDVSVFTGRVETRAGGDSSDAGINQLAAGASRRFRGGVGQDASPRLDRAAFPTLPSDTRDWPVTNGRMRLLESAPTSLAGLESNDFILLYREKRGVALPPNLMLDITAPGIYATNESVRPRPIPGGQVADSYLMHFRARHELVGEGKEWVVLDGSVTFSRPILGVACRTPSLRATDQLVTTPTAAEPDANDGAGWGVEFDNHDHVVLSTDRRTLWVSLRVDAYVDHLRIFVQAAG